MIAIFTDNKGFKKSMVIPKVIPIYYFPIFRKMTCQMMDVYTPPVMDTSMSEFYFDHVEKVWGEEIVFYREQ